jgi:hypothetical protein
MSRADRRREAKLAGVPWRDIRAAEKAEGVALRMDPAQARAALARWAAEPGRTQAEIDALNGAMPASAAVEALIRHTFEEDCGTGARYLRSELGRRGEHATVAVQFEMIPEGRQFNLDGVIRSEGEEGLRAAVLKIADIARNIRDHIKPETKQ